MGDHAASVEVVQLVASEDVLCLKIKQYEQLLEQYHALLKGSLAPKARKMLELLLARARSNLGALEHQLAAAFLRQAWTAERADRPEGPRGPCDP